ncbi:hypothetical protein [Puniceibacterium sp. IMCC21224]|uniref:hypothetical protein n=1 Tax=Puniceibacterium sp. IMCC21224 TaxID=1618204 RepID=UPI00064DF2F7|nr:hypothetical protein [Puniceibacterium sp. IMCC21224]KMK67581.1 hypothetical protein IMCC21224_112452 [Puniceibacterium sp. IMCC21224]
MTEEEFSKQVDAVEKLAKDKDAQLDLGKRLVAEVADAIMLERKGAEIDKPDFEMSFQQGERVPSQLRGQIKVDREGRALEDATLQYLNLRIWFRIWFRLWARIVWGFEFAQTPLNRFEEIFERVNFSAGEVDLMKRLRGLSR